jgi:inosine/xanthosine triphosphate pyrophosphatase family protein
VQIVIGTTNPAKTRQCRLALAASGLRMQSLTDALPAPPNVVEDGWNAEENATRKARAYSAAAGLPVLSLDYALVIDGLPAERQPGMNVRRIPGVEGRASDEQLIDYYRALFEDHGGRVSGRWEAGAAVATPRGHLTSTTIPIHRTFVSTPSARRVEGYPLACLQLADDGTYISELGNGKEEQLLQRVLGEPLLELLTRAFDPSLHE